MALRLLSFHIPVLWLKPEVDVVSRDRGGCYIDGVDSEWVLQNFPESLAVTMSTKRV
jgi:hypothetical protein